MSDLRALMRAQKSSNRIQHPYARYNNLGALSCSLCSLPLKSEVLWPSHLTSKTHRSNLKRVKEEQEKATAAAAVASSSKGLKRQAEPDADNAEDEAAKRARVDTQEERTSDDSPSFLPAGFFGNPEDASEANADDVGAADPSEPIDEEWAAFEATLQQPEEPLASTSTGYTTAATITAQPVLFEDDEQEDGNGAGQAGNEARDAEVDDHDEEPKETEEERQEREEREELMERIETYVSSALRIR